MLVGRAVGARLGEVLLRLLPLAVRPDDPGDCGGRGDEHDADGRGVGERGDIEEALRDRRGPCRERRRLLRQAQSLDCLDCSDRVAHEGRHEKGSHGDPANAADDSLDRPGQPQKQAEDLRHGIDDPPHRRQECTAQLRGKVGDLGLEYPRRVGDPAGGALEVPVRFGRVAEDEGVGCLGFLRVGERLPLSGDPLFEGLGLNARGGEVHAELPQRLGLPDEAGAELFQSHSGVDVVEAGEV